MGELRDIAVTQSANGRIELRLCRRVEPVLRAIAAYIGLNSHFHGVVADA
jgi:hypothetical protein